MTHLRVHPAAELFPLLSGPELDQLAADIAANGLRHPVTTWDDPERGTVLLDGRNRVAACERAGVPVRVQAYTGDDPVGFVVSANLARRHLTAGQRAAVGAALLPLYAEQAAARVGGRPRKDAAKPEADLPQVSDPAKRAPQSRDRAAAVVGTSGRAVAQYLRVAETAPDLAERVRSGSLPLDRAERLLRDRAAERAHAAAAQAAAGVDPAQLVADIRLGDFRDVLADLVDVDAVITDPPYGREHLPLLADLATWADKVLAPDGLLVVLLGQSHLTAAFRLLDDGRPYRWTGCYLTEGRGYVAHHARVQSSWKPLLVYGGGPRFADVVRSADIDGAAKDLHRWGQDYSGFHTLVERFTAPGQTVVDPFCGSGTTLLAARALGRSCVGADIDPVAVATTRERLG